MPSFIENTVQQTRGCFLRTQTVMWEGTYQHTSRGEVLAALTASGASREVRERAEELADIPDTPRTDQDVIRPFAAPLYPQGHLAILRGNLAPEGAVIKSTAIDPAVVDADGVYRKEGPARVFTSEAAAIAALREGRIQAGDVMVLCGIGPMGTGMEETYQLTSALKHLPFGKHVALITDARFSGVSTGACVAR